MRSLIIGRGGLLGSALARQTKASFSNPSIPWTRRDDVSNAIRALVLDFASNCGDEPWQVCWVAGSAVTTASNADVETELDSFHDFCQVLRRHAPRGPGSVFLASSAGGVYAGSQGAPFSERSPTRALSPYGQLKLSQESLAIDLANHFPVVIGRIANLYGPGQSLRKVQGLITRLVLAAVTRSSLNIFVPLDTLRDYVYVDDAAATILDWLHVARREGTGPGYQIRVIASGRAVSVAYVLRLTQSIARRRIPIALGTHASATSHAMDLRLTPSRHPLVRSSDLTSLAIGVKSVLADVERQHRGALVG